MSSLSRCASCNQQIRWIRMKTGKFMPVNPQKIPYIEGRNGDYTLVTPEGNIVTGTRVDESEKYGYISHFATCPNAGYHRKRR